MDIVREVRIAVATADCRHHRTLKDFVTATVSAPSDRSSTNIASVPAISPAIAQVEASSPTGLSPATAQVPTASANPVKSTTSTTSFLSLPECDELEPNAKIVTDVVVASSSLAEDTAQPEGPARLLSTLTTASSMTSIMATLPKELPPLPKLPVLPTLIVSSAHRMYNDSSKLSEPLHNKGQHQAAPAVKSMLPAIAPINVPVSATAVSATSQQGKAMVNGPPSPVGSAMSEEAGSGSIVSLDADSIHFDSDLDLDV